MKKIAFVFLVVNLICLSLTAQKDNFKLELEDIINGTEMDLSDLTKDSKDLTDIILKRYKADKRAIMKKAKISEAQYNKIALGVLAKWKYKSPKAVAQGYKQVYKASNSNIKYAMELVKKHSQTQNQQSASSQSGTASDILSAGASGAAVGAGIGGGIGAAVGAGAGGVGAGPGAAVGGAIGGALGAAFGIGVGIGEAIAEGLSEDSK